MGEQLTILDASVTTARDARREMRRSAVLSDCDTWRYRLGRRWAEGPTLCWVMLNPSTADALVDDPTIRRCIGFAQRDGYGAIDVVNRFAYRSTDPSDLLKVDVATAVGPDNLAHWAEAFAAADRVVAAWGAWSDRPTCRYVTTDLELATEWWCLGTTKSGAPRHPLYVAGATPLVRYLDDVALSGDPK